MQLKKGRLIQQKVHSYKSGVEQIARPTMTFEWNHNEGSIPSTRSMVNPRPRNQLFPAFLIL